MNGRFCILCAALLGATGVAMGAFQSHGLEKMLEGTQALDAETLARRLAVCGDGVRYQLYHAIAFLGIGSILLQRSNRLLTIAAGILLVGTVVFSGALYAIVFLNNSKFGMVAPIGGLLLILGWCMVAAGALTLKQGDNEPG